MADKGLTEPEIRWIINRFEKTGSVEYRRICQQARSARICENIAIVSESVLQDPITLTRRSLQQLNITVLHIDLYFNPYKIQLA